MRRPLSLLLALAFLPVVPAWAEDPAAKGATDPAALAAAVKARASIPVPEEEKKLAFEFEGDLVVKGGWAGTVKYAADTGMYKGKPIWLVTEELVQDFGGTKMTTSASYYLAKDLTFLRGEWQRVVAGGATVHLDLVRTEGGVEVTRDPPAVEGAEPPPPLVIPADAHATLGPVAMLLFLKYAPKGTATYLLPVVDLELAVPAVTEHDPVHDPSPARVTVKAEVQHGGKAAAEDFIVATVEVAHTTTELHLLSKDRSLVSAERLVPAGLSIVPKGSVKKEVSEDDKPSTTWQAVFTKFLHGYHLAVPKLIEDAVAWRPFYDHEVAAGLFRGDNTLEQFKDAYIGEFMRRSKHRPRAQADALIAMTMATATQKTEDDGTIVLATSPDFGGNVVHMRQIGKYWLIVQIDQ